MINQGVETFYVTFQAEQKLNNKLTQIDELIIENYKDELKQSWMPFSSSRPRGLALVKTSLMSQSYNQC